MTAKLKKELDRVFSLWVRQRDSVDGRAKCITCGKLDGWRKLQCGHYYSRVHLPLRWEEKNTAVQCVGCNVFSQGKGPEFARYLQKKHGDDVLEYLENKKNNKVKLDRNTYQFLISEYKEKILSINGVIK